MHKVKNIIPQAHKGQSARGTHHEDLEVLEEQSERECLEDVKKRNMDVNVGRGSFHSL